MEKKYKIKRLKKIHCVFKDVLFLCGVNGLNNGIQINEMVCVV